jgi:hypothetical protein
MDPEHTELLQLWNSPERNGIIKAGAAVGFVATLALPAVTMAGVFAALGSDYAAVGYLEHRPGRGQGP